MIDNLGVVIPIYNEENIIEDVIFEWNDYLIKQDIKFEFIIINDGSTDNSKEKILEISKKINNIILLDKKNSGHGPSCIYGYKHCINLNKYDWVLQIDSDFQCDPIYFSSFLEKNKNYKAVFGNRKKRLDGGLRILISNILIISILILKFKFIRDPNVPYRLMHISILKRALKSFPPNIFLSNVFISLRISNLCDIKWINIIFRDRKYGSSKTNLVKMLFKYFEFIKNLLSFN